MPAPTHHRFAIYCATVIFLCAAPISEAQVFECRDTNGKKIFAQACPAGSKQIKELEILSSPAKTSSSNTAQSNASSLSLAENEQSFKKRQNAKEEEAAKERDRLRALDSECFGLKQKLAGVVNGIPITVNKDAEGNPIFMDDAKREALGKELIEKLKKCP